MFKVETMLQPAPLLILYTFFDLENNTFAIITGITLWLLMPFVFSNSIIQSLKYNIYELIKISQIRGQAG